MKDYFSHDYNARNDKKLVKVGMKHGMSGIGVFWCIAEMLYEEGGELDISECDRIAYELRVEKDLVLSIVKDFELFKIAHDIFYSETISHRIFMRNSRSEKARDSASTRWGKDVDANAYGAHSDGIAKKGKEKKGKKIKIEQPLKKEFPQESNEHRLGEVLFELIKKNHQTHKFHNFTENQKETRIQKYASDVDLMLRNEKRDLLHLEFLLAWCQSNDFWKAQILSMKNFRNHFDTMTAKAQYAFAKHKEVSSKNQIL